MKFLPHLAMHVFGTPLLIHGAKLNVIVRALGSRIGLDESEITDEVVVALDPPSPFMSGKIAVIPIYGTLVKRVMGIEADSGLTSYSSISAEINAALSNSEVTGIILDIDSPGGEPGALFDLIDQIRAATATKPIWAVANDLAFSAAYAIASAANKVLVTRTGGVGSVGVLALHIDQSGYDAQEGVRYTSVFAGAHKNDFDAHQPISDDARAILQNEVNRVYGMLVETVARNRNLSTEAVRATEAALYYGKDAVASGLADGVSTLESAIAELSTSLSSPIEPAVDEELPESTIEPTEPVDPVDAPVIDDPAEADEELVMKSALAIVQTCMLAGKPELIEKFLQTKTPLSEVRQHLLAVKASGTEIVSLVPLSKNTATNDNPMITAAKQRAALMKTSKG